MQALIYKKTLIQLLPPHNYLVSSTHKDQNFLKFPPKIGRYTLETRILRTGANSSSLGYGGWDDYDSVKSIESNHLHSVLNFLGIADKKYAFVYLFGFVCALAVSKVKVSSVIVFPATAIVFAVGFSMGLVKGGQWREVKVNESRRKLVEETFRGFIERLRRLGDNLSAYKTEVANLKDGIRRSIECNQVSVSDLEGFANLVDSIEVYFTNAKEEAEGCIHNILGVNQDREEVSSRESNRKKGKGVNGFNLAQFLGGIFEQKFDSSKPGKIKVSGGKELANAGIDDRKQSNILAASAKPFDSTVRSQDCAENLSDGTRMNNRRNFIEENDTAGSVFDQTVYSYQNKTSRSVSKQQVYSRKYQDRTETLASQDNSFDSVDFSISMKHTKTGAHFGHQENLDIVGEDQRESQKYSFRKKMFSPLSEPSFSSQESPHENIVGSSVLDNDLEFNRYITEANNLLKQAKESFRQKTGNGAVEKTLNKSAVLLSKAIDMRPMSLLAVGQLGNTYLLHGELKLRVSRKLRSLLARTDPLSDDDWGTMLDKFDDQLVNKDEIASTLVDVCEECEELLIKAGRKYKLALSIDGNDMRALYNWGLALGFRAQLIADIGPSAARDADKLFMAAIDKFDGMLSKSNVYAPDALFRWGTALQQRSRLRPRNSREKVKLLQQARCLYEDALNMDSGNLQLQEALSSCSSELDNWYL